MNLREKAYIFLELFESLTYKKKRDILSLFPYPENLFQDFAKKEVDLLKIVKKSEFNNMCDYANESSVDKFINNVEALNVGIITAVSKNYPEKLLEMPDFPLVLYYKGNLSLVNTKSVGIVGARRITRYGKSVTENFAASLALAGITIVSGMAEGVDTVAHNNTLKVNGKTIAVLGSGFNEIYPKSNSQLFEQICKNGLVLTEYKPSIKPVAYNFPVRNRIIAALSDAVLITEAGEKSGALHTRDYALEYNKELFAVPGNIDSPQSVGTNNILKTCQGAIALTPQDILDCFNTTFVVNNKPQSQGYQLNINQNLIVNVLKLESKSFDEIVEETKLDTKTLMPELTILELYGIIERLPNNFYKLK